MIAEECFQYLVWVTGIIEKIPRAHKFTVGDKIHLMSIDLQMLIVEAAYTRDRTAQLRRAQILLEQLRFLFRLSMESRLINSGSYEFAARSLDGIGRGLGGWKKAHDAKTTRQSFPTNRDIPGAANSRADGDQG